MTTPSPSMGRLIVARARELRRQSFDPRGWIETNLWIATKDQREIPLVFNAIQSDYYLNRTNRDLILKSRQVGITTVISALYFADCLLTSDTVSVMIAHDLESVERIFSMVHLFLRRLPKAERQLVGEPRYSNRKELFWPEINSRFFVGTSGAPGFGRGHTIHNLHCSEFALWRDADDSLAAAMEAVPASGRVVIESTANGMGNPFHDLWRASRERRSRFTPVWYLWFEDPEYTEPMGEPLGDLSVEEQQLVRRYQLTEGQIRWRRQKIMDQRGNFWQEYPEDDVTCFLASGRCCFDTAALTRIQREIAAAAAGRQVQALYPDRKGERQTVSIAPATLTIWQAPVPGATYVIGADVGEGLEQGDASAAVVLDFRSGEQVAELHGRVPPERFAQLLDALGRHYHQATIAVERNNHGHSTLNTLQHTCRYPNLYRYVRWDRGTRSTGVPVLGWPTDQSTKPILVDDLAAAIAGDHIGIRSAGLVDECFTFVTTDSGAQEAQEGKHDDRVIAAGIAWQARRRSRQRPPRKGAA